MASGELPGRRGAMGTLGYYLLLSALAIPFLLPLLWMALASFRPPAELYQATFQWLPDQLTLANFRQAWQLLSFPRFLLNSVLVASVTAIATALSSSLVGYAFAVIPARGREALFMVMMATVIVPPTVLLLPQFILFSRLGWVNTYLPLIVPALFSNAFYVFLFRQFFRTLPAELFESAEIDGCNPLRAYWQIALPLSVPALAAVAVFSFIAAWNDFLGPLVYLNSPEKFTLSLGLSLFEGLYGTELHYMMPMSMLALLPVIALFFLFQRYLERGFLSA